MSRIADRLLARIAGKAGAAAGCTTYSYCKFGSRYNRHCCLNEGCWDEYTGGRPCP